PARRVAGTALPARRLRRGRRRGRAPGRVAAARARRPHPVRPRRQPPGAGVRARPARGAPGPGVRAGGVRPFMSVSASLKVLSPGLHSLVVDRGRPGCRSLGVPVGGAADAFSLAVGNALVGNDPGAAALEVTLAGPTLEATAELG